MRKNGIDKLEFLVLLAAAALVIVVAVGTAPAYSDDSRTDPAEIHHTSAKTSADVATVPSPEPTPEPQQAETVDTDGYEWSGSRPADERYVWSHRPN